MNAEKQAANNRMMEQVYEKRKAAQDSKPAPAKALTVDAYNDLKKEGFSDKMVGVRFDMDNNAIQKFKRENGLIKQRAAEPVAAVKPAFTPPETAVVVSKVKYSAIQNELEELKQKLSAKDSGTVVQAEPETVPSIKGSILETIGQQIDQQTEKGTGKYSHSLDDCPTEKYDWQQMINEELIDALQYQQKEIRRLQDRPKGLTLDEFQRLSERTAEPHTHELLNYGLGISGEAGEVSDLIKKSFFQGHSFAVEDIRKELGDVLWYVSQIARLAGTSLEEVARANVEKLKKRYPDGFSEEASVNRTE